MSMETIRKALVAWAIKDSGIPAEKVYWENQDFAKQKSPLLTLKISAIQALNMDFVSPPSGSGESNINGDREFSVSVNCYGVTGDYSNDPMDVLSRMYTSLSLVSTMELLEEAGICSVD